MKFELTQNVLHKISADILLVFAFQDDNEKKPSLVPTAEFSFIDKVLDGKLTKAANAEHFTGEKGQTVSLYPGDDVVATKVVALGLGKRSGFVLQDLRREVGKFAGQMKKKIDSVAVGLPLELELDAEEIVHVITEGLALGSYDFGQYKAAKPTDRKFETAILVTNERTDKNALKEAIAKAELYAKATILARDLVNEQSAVMTPTKLAELAKNIAKASPQITCKVFDKEQAQKMGMEAFLGIARAADTPPKFIFLEYIPEKPKGKRKLALVGKGITFDSGGINVKPGDYMSDMKMDMSGAATVLGVFSVIAEIKPDYPVIGLIAATPNMISGSSIVPGDVVRAMNGKSIEVLNTDAEGRVTMADSLSFAVKEKATHIIDFATLTGACMVALGDEIAGLMTNDRDLSDAVKTAAFSEGEKVWELPLDEDYKKMNKSDVADVANIPNTRYGGAIAAGLFLQEFVDNTPWVHLDIAGPAFAHKPLDLGPKGGTGFGVRTVLQLLEENPKE